MLLTLATNKAAKIRAKKQVFTQGEAALSKHKLRKDKNSSKQEKQSKTKRKKLKKYTVRKKNEIRSITFSYLLHDRL